MLPVMTSLRIVYRAAIKWSENGGTRLGAALAYYAIFSIGPLLLVAIHIAGAVFGEEAAKGTVHNRVEWMLGNDTIAKGIEKIVEDAPELSDAGWGPTVSIALLVIASLGGFLHVRTALCAIWKLEPPHGNSWLGMLLDYFLAVVMVFIIAALFLVSLACSLAVPILQSTMERTQLDVKPYWQWVELGGSFVFLTLLFATVYRVLSGGRIGWGYVWYGSLIAAILFSIGKTVLSFYIVYSGTASMYGAAGSIVVFMMWVYYSSQTLFFGAELIQARRTRHEWMTIGSI